MAAFFFIFCSKANRSFIVGVLESCRLSPVFSILSFGFSLPKEFESLCCLLMIAGHSIDPKMRPRASWRPVLWRSLPPKKNFGYPQILSSFYADNDLQKSAPPNVPDSPPPQAKTSRKPYSYVTGWVNGHSLPV